MAVVRLRHQLTMQARIIRTRFFFNAVWATWRLSVYGPLSRYSPSSKAETFTTERPKKWENVLLPHSYRIKMQFFQVRIFSDVYQQHYKFRQVWREAGLVYSKTPTRKSKRLASKIREKKTAGFQVQPRNKDTQRGVLRDTSDILSNSFVVV